MSTPDIGDAVRADRRYRHGGRRLCSRRRRDRTPRQRLLQGLDGRRAACVAGDPGVACLRRGRRRRRLRLRSQQARYPCSRHSARRIFRRTAFHLRFRSDRSAGRRRAPPRPSPSPSRGRSRRRRAKRRSRRRAPILLRHWRDATSGQDGRRRAAAVPARRPTSRPCRRRRRRPGRRRRRLRLRSQRAQFPPSRRSARRIFRPTAFHLQFRSAHSEGRRRAPPRPSPSPPRGQSRRRRAKRRLRLRAPSHLRRQGRCRSRTRTGVAATAAAAPSAPLSPFATPIDLSAVLNALHVAVRPAAAVANDGAGQSAGRRGNKQRLFVSRRSPRRTFCAHRRGGRRPIGRHQSGVRRRQARVPAPLTQRRSATIFRSSRRKSTERGSSGSTMARPRKSRRR